MNALHTIYTESAYIYRNMVLRYSITVARDFHCDFFAHLGRPLYLFIYLGNVFVGNKKNRGNLKLG